MIDVKTNHEFTIQQTPGGRKIADWLENVLTTNGSFVSRQETTEFIYVRSSSWMGFPEEEGDPDKVPSEGTPAHR